MQMNRLAAAIIWLGLIGVLASVGFWLISYLGFIRSAGLGDTLGCLFFTTGPCAAARVAAVATGRIFYDPVIFWAFAIVLLFGFVLLAVVSRPGLRNFLFFIDTLSMWVGKSFAWLILVLTLGISYEVFVRYALRAPTTWAFDISYITYGAMFLMAGAYALSRGSHVRADVVYRLWKPRTQASMDLLLYILFFLPAVAALIYSGWNYAKMSVQFREVSIFSPAGVPVFPLKALIPITGVLLLIQGIAEIIRCIICIRDGEWPQRLHDVEETESLILQEQRIHAADSAQPQTGEKRA
jgi:TRAP-type mannitol/chloroaromatic compound transport system permease small subunit